MSRRASVWLGTIAAALSLSACATMKTGQDDLEELKDSIEAYNHSFRWKSYEQASLFLPPDLRGSFIAAYENDESSLQIEDYRVSRYQLHDDKSATVLIRIRYLLLPSVIVQKVTLVQHWHKIAGSWLLETEENSIRKIDPTRLPADLREAPAVPPEAEGQTEVETFGPGDDTPAPN